MQLSLYNGGSGIGTGLVSYADPDYAGDNEDSKSSLVVAAATKE